MSGFDKNKIFFGLVHYILSEQKNVDWILKTSLIDITGISSVLEEKPYNRESLLNDVIDYVTEMKPYHVQFSRYFEHYETAIETIRIPKNDIFKTIINQRFDAIQTTPDIQKMIYSREYKKDNQLPSGAEYNTEGLEILEIEESKLYTRYKDENNDWYWEEFTGILLDGIYYETKNNSYFLIKDNKISDEEFNKEEFITSHMANRLFYLGLHNYDEIKKELDANFKGIEVNGDKFYLGEFGYDVADYDTTDYDAPTIVYDYCFLEEKDEIHNDIGTTENYKKVYVDTGSHYFSLPNFSHNLTPIVYKQKFDSINSTYSTPIVIHPDIDTTTNNNMNYLEVYDGLHKKDKITVAFYNTSNALEEAYVIVGYPFVESNSEILKKKIVYLESSSIFQLETPIGGIDTNKLAIQIKSKGKTKPFNEFKQDGSYITIDRDRLNPEDHIIITSFDYKYLYDKIYTWEDLYGRSNNTTRLAGGNFLRALNESDRPRELTVSHPQTNLVVYFEKDKKIDVFYNDYKNDLYNITYDKSQILSITDIEYTYYDDYKSIKSISLSDVGLLKDAPGKILINSEIIEYNKVDRSTNTISSLRRGVSGSILRVNQVSDNLYNGDSIDVGTNVYPYDDEFVNHVDKNGMYVSYTIKDPNILEYSCPFGVKEDSEVEVKLLKKINLLKDITYYSEEIVIDSCNIVDNSIQDKVKYESTQKKYNGNFYLKINDITLPFSYIYKVKNKKNEYCIGGFELPKEFEIYGSNPIYTRKSTFIHPLYPEDFTDYKLSFVSREIDFNTECVDNEIFIKSGGNNIYRIVGNIIYDEYDNNQVEIGTYLDNTLYRLDGTIIGKIIDNVYYDIEPIIILNNRLNIGEHLHIKVCN